MTVKYFAFACCMLLAGCADMPLFDTRPLPSGVRMPATLGGIYEGSITLPSGERTTVAIVALDDGETRLVAANGMQMTLTLRGPLNRLQGSGRVFASNTSSKASDKVLHPKFGRGTVVAVAERRDRDHLRPGRRDRRRARSRRSPGGPRRTSEGAAGSDGRRGSGVEQAWTPERRVAERTCQGLWGLTGRVLSSGPSGLSRLDKPTVMPGAPATARSPRDDTGRWPGTVRAGGRLGGRRRGRGEEQAGRRRRRR